MTAVDVFTRRAEQERGVNHSICSVVVDDGVAKVKVPVWLDELDPTRGKGRSLPAFDCSLMCAIAEDEMNGSVG